MTTSSVRPASASSASRPSSPGSPASPAASTSRRYRSQWLPAGQIVAASSTKKSPAVPFHGLDSYALETAHGNGVAAALDGDTLLLEKHRYLRAQSRTQEWLRTALHSQVAAFRKELTEEDDWQDREARRLAVLELQQRDFGELLQEKRESTLARHDLTAEHRADIQRQNSEYHEAKAMKDRAGEARFQLYKADQQEEAQMEAARLQQLRQDNYDEAVRIMEERRQHFATRARSKDSKQETIASERRHLWQFRRLSNEQAAKSYDQVCNAITAQRISCKLDANAIQELAEDILGMQLQEGQDPCPERLLHRDYSFL